jgi:hypothetical protein
MVNDSLSQQEEETVSHVPAKWVWKQRSFKQLLIKGDSVVSIALLTRLKLETK